MERAASTRRFPVIAGRSSLRPRRSGAPFLLLLLAALLGGAIAPPRAIAAPGPNETGACPLEELGPLPLEYASPNIWNIDGRLWAGGLGTGLSIVDLSDPDRPQLVGWWAGVVDLTGVAVVGNRALLTDRREGLLVVDISDLAAPVELGRLPVSGGVTSVVASGSLAFVATDRRVLVVDVSDPTHPRELSRIETDSGSLIPFGTVVISGSTLVVSTGSGILFVDIADPAAPRVVSRFGDRSMGLRAATPEGLVFSGWDSLALLDIGDPEFAKIIARRWGIDYPSSVTVDGESVWIVSDAWGGGSRLSLYRIDRPAKTFEPVRTVDLPARPRYLVPFGEALVTAREAGALPRIYRRPGCLATTELAADFELPDPIVVGEPVVFRDRSRGEVVSRRWLLNERPLPGGAATLPDPSVTFSSVGDFRVALEVTGPDGETSTRVGTVFVFPAGSCRLERRPAAVGFEASRLSTVARGSSLFAVVDSPVAGRGEIWDITDPGLPSLLSRLPESSGVVAAGGNVAVASDSPQQVTLFDIGDPAAPRESARVSFSSPIVDLVVSDDGAVAWVATATSGLVGFDVTDPAAPVEIASVAEDLTTSARLRLEGSRLLLSDDGEVRIFDVSAPTRPVRLPFSGRAYPYSPSGLDVDGRFLALAGASGLEIWDLEDPEGPTRVRTESPQLWARSVAFVDGRLFGTATLPWAPDVSAIDLGEIWRPRPVGGLGHSLYDSDLWSRSGRLFAVEPTGQVHLLDATPCQAIPVRPTAEFQVSPALPQEGESVLLESRASGRPGTWSWDFGDGTSSTSLSPHHVWKEYGDYLVRLTVSNEAGTHTRSRRISVSRPSRPPAPAFDFSPAWPNVGETVRFEDRTTGIPTEWRWNFGDRQFSDAASPEHVYAAPGRYRVTLTARNRAGAAQVEREVEIGSCRLAVAGAFDPRVSRSWDDPMVLDGSHLWMFSWYDEVVLFDVGDPSAPRRLSTLLLRESDTDIRSIAVAGNRVAVAGGQGGTSLIDATNPAQLRRLAWIASLDESRDVAFSNGRLFVADGRGGLRIFDLSDPAAPRQLGQWTSAWKADSVAIVGETAFVLAEQAGVEMLDVTDPAHPRRLGSLEIWASRLITDGEQLVAVGYDYATVIDSSQPDCLRSFSRVPKGLGGSGAALSGRSLLVVGRDGGLELHDLTDPSSPRAIGRLAATATLHAVATDGGRAVVVDAEEQARILDLSSCLSGDE